MRRRDRYIQRGVHYGAGEHSTSGGQPGQYTGEPHYQFNETPEEWCKHAREPWRILFPDLKWTPPDRDL